MKAKYFRQGRNRAPSRSKSARSGSEPRSTGQTRYALIPAGGVECVVCDMPVDLSKSGSGRIYRLPARAADGVHYAIVVCRRCDSRNLGKLPLLSMLVRDCAASSTGFDE